MSKIINYKYKTQAADLIHGKADGPVQGYHLNNDSKNQTVRTGSLLLYWQRNGRSLVS